MNLKRTLISGLAAVGLMASLAAPVALADDPITVEGSATVSIENDGEFTPYFCGAVELTPEGDVNSTTGTTAEGQLLICYTDTMAERDGFTTTLKAGVFTSNVNMPATNTSNPVPYTIPAENFIITTVYNPAQLQWGRTNPAIDYSLCALYGVAPDQSFHENVAGGLGVPGVSQIGNIGSYDANGVVVTGGSGTPWDASPSSANLSTAQTVGYGNAGVGTGTGAPHCWATIDTSLPAVDGTWAAYDVKLDIPAGSVGDFTSVLSLSVTMGQP